MAERRPVGQAVVAGVGLGEVGEPAVAEIERAAVGDRTADRGAVAADELGERVHDDVGAPLDRADEVRRRHRVVDDQRNPASWATLDTPSMSKTSFFGFDSTSPKNSFVFGRTAVRHCSRSSGSSTNVTSMPMLRQRVVEQVVGAAVERRRGDDVVADFGDRRDGQHLGGLPGPDRKRSGDPDRGGAAALQRIQARLERALRRVHDARVDVADLGQGEQVGGVGRVAELVARRLVDGHGTRPGGRIGISPDVDLACLETPCVTHGVSRYRAKSRPIKSELNRAVIPVTVDIKP